MIDFVDDTKTCMDGSLQSLFYIENNYNNKIEEIKKIEK